MERIIWKLMESVIVTKDSLEIPVMNFARKENLELLHIVRVAFSSNL